MYIICMYIRNERTCKSLLQIRTKIDNKKYCILPGLIKFSIKSYPVKFNTLS